jgi:hypothetical protein
MRMVLLALLLAPAPAAAQNAAAVSDGGRPASEPVAAALVLPTPTATLLADENTQAQPAPPARRRRRPSMVGYIEDASIRSQLRFRFDAGWGNNVPDRAEFFYAKCGCYQLDPPPYHDPDAPGPGPGVPTELNFQQFYAFAEMGVGERFSLFGELPVRMIQPQGFLDFGAAYAPWGDFSGISDIRFGAKASLYATEDAGVTVQARLSGPSGDAAKGLGSNLWSVEPMLLYHQNLGDRAGVEAQFGVWLPLGGSAGVDSADDFSGNVLSYGIGPSFDIVNTGRVQFSPVVELVGWHVLDGFMTSCTDAGCNFDASGGDIVNLKVGARTTVADRSSFYVGFGWGLTDWVWYDKLLRLEYRYGF